MEQRVAKVMVGEEHTFKRSLNGALVRSWIDFVVVEVRVVYESLEVGWGLYDHSRIGYRMSVDELVEVTSHRNAVDWDKVAVVVVDDSEKWYGMLAREAAYDKLVDFCVQHLKKI